MSQGMEIWYAPTLPDTITLELLPIPSLSDKERLEVTFNLFPPRVYGQRVSLSGDLLATMDIGGLSVYRLEAVTGRGNTARFRLVGRRQPTPLEKLNDLYGQHSSQIAVGHQGFAYVRRHDSDTVVVYDLKDQENPRRVGYYYLPPREGIEALVPLSKGRLLLVGREYLYVVKLRSAE
jgi:hypothetical protein